MSALRKVLVVDDDPVVGKSFDRVLSQKGYIVVTAEDAAQALEKMREQEYDVVFTDIRMPGMSGIELAEQVKAKRPWTPVVIVTGYGTKANEERAKAAGVSGFLNKPLSPEMIEESVAHALLKPETAVVAQTHAVAAEQVHPEPAEKTNTLRNIALFLAAPFIGLAYAVMLPFVGIAMLAWVGGKALLGKMPATRTGLTFAKNLGLLVAAPFIGLAYAVLLPFVGTAVLLWMGSRALLVKAPAR
jgi:CheY-like chemotaxis protein